MVMRKLLLTSAAAPLGLAVPAAACDLHGPGQIGGFHRYNPFANSLNNIRSKADQFAKSEVVATRDTSEKRKADEKKRERALDAEAPADTAPNVDPPKRQPKERAVDS